jgi:hypothetical protein
MLPAWLHDHLDIPCGGSFLISADNQLIGVLSNPGANVNPDSIPRGLKRSRSPDHPGDLQQNENWGDGKFFFQQSQHDEYLTLSLRLCPVLQVRAAEINYSY